VLAFVRCPQHGVFQPEIMSTQTAGALAHADAGLSITSMPRRRRSQHRATDRRPHCNSNGQRLRRRWV
jgi:hypothetical protein